MQVFWILCALFSVYVFVATNPSRSRQIQDIFMLNSAAFARFGFDRETLPLYLILLDSLAFLTYAMVGLLVFWRKSSDRVAFFGSLALVSAGITIARPTDSLFFVEPVFRLPILALFMLGTGSILLFLFLFPDGHFTPRWMVYPALILLGYPILLNIQQISAVVTAPWPPPSVAPFTVPAIVLALATQIYHYRRESNPPQRQQTKWVTFGLAIGAAGLIGFLVIVPLLVPQVLEVGIERAVYVVLGVPVFYVALTLLPLSIAMSILRYRLWDIDLLIRQTILYGALTAFVAGLFAASITLGQKVFLTLTGQRSDIATVVATLLVVAAITPVKDYLQRTIEKRLKGGPDPTLRLHGFVERVNARVSPVEHRQVSRRLVDEAVAAFNAKGGAVYWQEEGRLDLIYRTVEWDGDPRIHADLGEDLIHRLGVIALGERRSGEPYTPKDERVLQEVASAIAQAIEQDRT